MSTRFWACVLGFLILISCSSLTMAGDWDVVYQQNTRNVNLTKAWTSTGDWTAQEQAITVNSEQEAMLRLNQGLDASVIRVQFDFTCVSDAFSEAGILIGLGGGGRRSSVQFILQGGNHPTAQLIVPARVPMVVDDVQFTPGKTYQIIASVNGQRAELFINGTKIAQRQLMSQLAAGQVALLAREGQISFDNLLIRTQQVTDVQSTQRTPEQIREQAIQAQFEEGYIPPLWAPSELTFKQRSPRTRLKQVPIKVQSILATPGRYPLSVGVPVTDRHMFKPQQFRLLDAEGESIPCQITPTALWEQKGAIKWIMVDANVQIDDPTTPVQLTLEYGRSVHEADLLQTMPITENDTSLTVDCGRLKVSFSKTTGTLIETASLDGKPVMLPDLKRGGYFVDNKDQTYRTSGKDDQYTLVVEVAGSLHTILRATGWYVNDAGQKACRYVTRIHLYKDQPMIRMEHTWIVTVDTDTFWFKDIGLNLPMSIGTGGKALASTSNENLTESRTQRLGANTLSLTQNDLSKATITYAGKPLATSEQTGGWVSLLGQDIGATLSVRDMAMQFPNQLDVSEKGITFHAWQTLKDKELNFRHEGIIKLWGQKTWQRMNQNVTSQGALEARVSNGMGFARTHYLTLSFHEPKESTAQIAGALGQYEPIASVDPKWVKKTNVLSLALPVYDQKRFAEYETHIKEKFDEYVQAATHLEPMVGFWDYGRGCPRDLTPPPGSPGSPGSPETPGTPGTPGTSEIANSALASSSDLSGKTLGNTSGEAEGSGGGRWTYSGINANDDMSYGNPQVPWLLYLRSGDRKYLRWARAMTTHVMDTRIIHWYNKSLGREIGQSNSHTGTWVFDGSDAGWTGDIWAGFLATAYQVTGYQRSLDVLGEIANGYIHTKQDPVQNDQTVTYLGAIARYYTTNWDKTLLDTLVQTAPIYLQSQLETGFWPKNDPAFEYALLEMLMLPDIEQAWENIALNFARGAIGPMRFHTHWIMTPGIQAWAYTHKQMDARFGVNANEALANGIPKLTGYANLAPLRRALIWMGLSDVPEIDDIVQPTVLTFIRPQESVFYLKHEIGQNTHIELHCKQGEISITDLEGKPIASHLLRSQQTIGIYEITLRENLPYAQYKIQINSPGMYEANDGSLGRSLPWRPGENELLVVMHGKTQFVQDISNGKLTHFPGKQAWFFVPKRTTEFTLEIADPWPLINDLMVMRPDHSMIKTQGSRLTVKPESSQTGKLWMLQAKLPYFQCTQTSFARGPVWPGYLKLTGIPPVIAYSKDSFFRPIAATTQVDQPQTHTMQSVFPRGKFRRGVRLNGNQGYLKIPTGKVSEDPAKREFFNATRGTIEMYIRFDRRSIAGGYSGKLLHIPFAQSRIALLDFIPSSSWEGLIRSGDAQTRQIPLTDDSCTPSINADQWYHLAIQWDLNDNGKVMRRVYLDGYPYAFGDASGKHDPIDWWPQAVMPGNPGRWIYIGDHGSQYPVTSNIVIDELRISDIPRYPFMPGPPKVGGRKAFDPPQEPFAPDSHACAIYHFEGNVNGLSKYGKTIIGKRISIKLKAN